jgi:hypothetical protein
MPWSRPLPFIYRERRLFRGGLGLLAVSAVLFAGCSELPPHPGEERAHLISDIRHPIPLSPSAGEEHSGVMLQHLETIQEIVNALVMEDYELARGLTESHLGFFMHRQALAYQQSENFPPAYHDLAMAHHEAAEQLARIIPTKDLKQILPQFNNVLKACVACHLEFKVGKHS